MGPHQRAPADAVMWSQYRPRDRMWLRILLSVLWVAMAGIAIASILDPGASLVGLLRAQWAFIVGGGLAFACSLLALAGIILNRYRLEWLGAMFAPIGMVPYVVTAWWVLVDDGFAPARAISATFTILFPLLRSMHCMAHANRLKDLATPGAPIRAEKGRDR